CFYGIDFASPGELIANGAGTADGVLEGVRRAIGADSLGYVSEKGMIAATDQPKSRLCSACFDGNYPIPLPEDAAIGKNRLEVTAVSR
ncbi:MAG: amidophosphoribosyltransferase, partial [Mycobacteriaceae bacterium]